MKKVIKNKINKITCIPRISFSLNKYFRKKSSDKQPPSILIGGGARIGKSILASNISSGFGHYHLCTDQIVPRFWDIDDPIIRNEIRENTYKNLINSYPKGLLVEGEDLIYNNRSRDHHSKDVDLTRLKNYQNQYTILVVTLVLQIDNIENQVERMVKYSESTKCWASERYNKFQLRKFVEEIDIESEKVFEQSKKLGIPCLILNANEFAVSISASTKRLSELLHMVDRK